MAVTQLYTAVPNDVITAARWNNEFGNIYNNGTDLAFPLTEGVSFAGFTVTYDSAGVSHITSPATTGFLMTPGAKTGTPGTTGNTINVVANTFTDSNTAGSGTAAAFAATALQRPTLAASNTSVTTTDAATLYIANAPLAGTNETITNPWAIWVDSGAVRFDGALTVTGVLTQTGGVTQTGAITATSLLHKGTLLFGKPIGGLTYQPAADASNDITVAVGETVSDDATLADRRLMVLATAIVGQVDTGTWVVGTNQPKLDTGTVADVPYYIWLIQRADTGVVDILFSESGTAPTMPTDYAYKRLIGWFKRAASVNLAWKTYEMGGGGLLFVWVTPPIDFDLANTLTTSRRTDAVSVPAAFSVYANFRIEVTDAATHTTMFGNSDETDAAPSITTTPLYSIREGAAVQGVRHYWIMTNADGTIAARSLVTVDAYSAVTLQFIWSRR